MVQYETLPTLTLDPEKTVLCTDILPEVMYMEDPALSVMIDLTQSPPKTIRGDKTIDHALKIMKIHGAHLLFVVNAHEEPVGIIASEDILGERPIKIQQDRQIPRSAILVSHLMQKITNIPALDIEIVNKFKIGNVVNTLKTNQCHYALVVKMNGDKKIIRGLFTTSQISQQLHRPISS